MHVVILEHGAIKMIKRSMEQGKILKRSREQLQDKNHGARGKSKKEQGAQKNEKGARKRVKRSKGQKKLKELGARGRIVKGATTPPP